MHRYGVVNKARDRFATGDHQVVSLFQTAVKAPAHQQRPTQHHRNKPAHAVPAVLMPEHAAERPGDAGAQIVAEKIQRGRLAFGATGARADPAAGDRVGGEEAR